VKAERRVIEELVAEAQQVRGKAGILFRVAEAAVGHPMAWCVKSSSPVAGEQTFEALVREAKALGTSQKPRSRTAEARSRGPTKHRPAAAVATSRAPAHAPAAAGRARGQGAPAGRKRGQGGYRGASVAPGARDWGSGCISSPSPKA